MMNFARILMYKVNYAALMRQNKFARNVKEPLWRHFSMQRCFYYSVQSRRLPRLLDTTIQLRYNKKSSTAAAATANTGTAVEANTNTVGTTEPPIVTISKSKQSPILTTPIQSFKPRTSRKNRARVDEFSALGYLNVNGFSTAEEYDLEALLNALQSQNLYEAKRFFSTDNLGVEQNVLYVTAKYPVGEDPREIFFFREGSVVLWNCNATETNNVLSFLRPFERESYLQALVRGESEVMPYTYIPASVVDVEGDLVADTDYKSTRAFFQNGKFFLTAGDDNFLHKYTFSNAIATSIKLGMWEATLDRYIDSIEYLTEDLKRGRRLRISRATVLRKTGELFALRHVINLSSDLLDAPDFYWDHEELETLYLQVCSYFNISRRTKVMNEKINHCVELAELVSHNLNDAHHIRLEWMIIILIMVEVAFEVLHFLSRQSEPIDTDERSVLRKKIAVPLITQSNLDSQTMNLDSQTINLEDRRS